MNIHILSLYTVSPMPCLDHGKCGCRLNHATSLFAGHPLGPMPAMYGHAQGILQYLHCDLYPWGHVHAWTTHIAWSVAADSSGRQEHPQAQTWRYTINGPIACEPRDPAQELLPDIQGCRDSLGCRASVRDPLVHNKWRTVNNQTDQHGSPSGGPDRAPQL